MVSNRGLCFLIADGEHARFVEADADNVLRTVRSFDSASAHLASHDLGSDRPGRDYESATTGSHGEAPRHDPHQLEKTKFARFVADELGVTARERALDRLVLVAPAHCLSDITDALDAQTTALVTGRLAKDLVKIPDHELSPHLREWVPPPHRAF
jgi:protein required for attachment to host cells